MASITTRVTEGGGATVKGTPLSNAELDVNFINLNTDKLDIANNLSDVVNKSTARTNLGVAIGTNVQAYDANLTSFVNAFTLPTADGTAGQFLKTDGSGTLSFETVNPTPFSNNTALAQVQAVALSF
jgi:hypothetical protein